MESCPIFTAVARDLQLDPELLLAAPEVPAGQATVTAGQQSG